MPELRKDPIVGRWVIIADERAKRPHDFKSEAPLPRPTPPPAPSAKATKKTRLPKSSPIATTALAPTDPVGASASSPTASPHSRSKAT